MNDIIMWLLKVFLVCVLAIFLIAVVLMMVKYIKKLTNDIDSKTDEAAEAATVPADEKLPYVLNNPIMSPKERSFYRSVKPIADELALTVFCKVRLADLVNVPKDTNKWHTWFNYIKSKHIDFVLVDKDMNIKVLIEVDDKTHNRDDRKQRDEFVDKIFKQLGIEVLHIYSWGNSYGEVNLKSTIIAALNPIEPVPAAPVSATVPDSGTNS